MVAAAAIGGAVISAGATMSAGNKAAKAQREALAAQREGRDAAIYNAELQFELGQDQLAENKLQFRQQLDYLKEREQISDERYNELLGQYNERLKLADARYDDVYQKFLPYITQGQNAITRQSDLLGLNGTEPQQKAIDAIKMSPIYQNLISESERAVLANASATGGLRGGNTQDALMRLRPQILSDQIQQQIQNFGSVAGLGMNAIQGTNTGTPGLQLPGGGDLSQTVSSAFSNNAAQQAALGGQLQQTLGLQGNIAQNYANNVSNFNIAQGQLQAQTGMNAANTISSGITNGLLLQQLSNSNAGLKTGA